MLKSPEQYLAGLSFDAFDPDKDHLNAGERAFVEKYLGFDLLEKLPPVEPESLPLPELLPLEKKQPSLMVAEREIVIVPDAPVAEAIKEESRQQAEIAAQVDSIEASSPPAPTVETAETNTPTAESVTNDELVGIEPPSAPAESGKTNEEIESAQKTAAPAVQEKIIPTVASQLKTGLEQTAVPQAAVEVAYTTAQAETPKPNLTAAKTPVQAKTPEQAALKPEIALREKWRKMAEIQMVSFFVAGQIFLLPVEGIQEVVRHMELIKVPQAPEFVAGVINLRGAVTPVIQLSALLTNAGIKGYDERNFIIITGTDKLQLGLIIDKVSNMHMVPQNKIIWNPESKLAEAAEFLNAIVDLDDHVCGMVAPEAITRLILPEMD